MRIVHFLSGLDRGGAQRMVATLTREQVATHEVAIWLKCNKDHAFEIDARVTIKTLPRQGCLSFLRTIIRIRRQLIVDRPHLVIAHTNRNTTPAIIAGLLAGGIPVIAMEHSVYKALQSPVWRLLRLFSYSLAASVVVLSRDQIARYPGGRVRRIPNPVESFLDNESVSETPHDGPKKLRIVFAGRLEAVKGPDRILSICRRIQIPFHLDIVGSGSMEGQIRDLVARFGLGSYVTLHGWQVNVAPFFCEADVVVVTSRVEGFGLAVLEPMTAGCIPVVYDVEGGLSDIVSHGSNGFLIADGDISAFVDALQRIYFLTPDIIEMRKQARATVSAYTPSRIAEHWEYLMEKCVRTRVP